MKRLFYAAAILLAGIANAAAADLTVTIDGVQVGKGNVMVALFDTATGFPAKNPKLGQMQPANQASLNFSFNGLAPGRYAVSSFQDINSNGHLDINMMGIPQEPYGFSRNAHGDMGPPKFDDSAFSLGSDKQVVVVHLK